MRATNLYLRKIPIISSFSDIRHFERWVLIVELTLFKNIFWILLNTLIHRNPLG